MIYELNNELIKYKRVSKKYNKLSNAFNAIGHFMSGISILATSSALGTGLSGIGFVVAIPLGAIGALGTLGSSGSTIVAKKMNQKEAKHDKTVHIIKNTLLNLKRLCSKLLNDGNISEEEFQIVLELESNYYKQKEDIRTNEDKVKKAFIDGQKSMKKRED